MSTLLFYINFIVGLIMVRPLAFIADNLLKKGEIEKHDAYSLKVVKKWASSRIKYSNSKIIIKGLENIPKDKTILFVSNHQSNFDIPILISCLPGAKGFIAKIELSKIPCLTVWMKHIYCLFMDRDDLKQSMNIIIEGIKILKSGYNMVVFPEGTRSKGDKMNEFKPGSFKLATKSGAIIVPVTIDGSYKALDFHKPVFKKVNIGLYIHKPIDPATLSKEELANLHNTVFNIINSSVGKTKQN